MAFFTETHAALEALAVTLGADIQAAGVPGAVGRLADDQVEAVMRLATVLVQAGECLRICGCRGGGGQIVAGCRAWWDGADPGAPQRDRVRARPDRDHEG